MTQATFECKINAPFDLVWQALMDEVENPHTYNPKINGAKILERFHDGVLRVVAVPDADVRERVIFDYEKGEITSTLVGHPQLVGEIRKTLAGSQGNRKPPLTLHCSLKWQSTDQNIDQMLRRNVESFILNGLDHVRQQAEKA